MGKSAARSAGLAVLPLVLVGFLLAAPLGASARCGGLSELSHKRMLKTATCNGFNISEGLNYQGGDITNVWAASAEECCEQCKNYVGAQNCTSWTYGNGWSPNPCWLKGSGYADPPVNLYDGAISGKLIETTPECEGFKVDSGIRYAGILLESHIVAGPAECCAKCKAYSGARRCDSWWYANATYFHSTQVPGCYLAANDSRAAPASEASYGVAGLRFEDATPTPAPAPASVPVPAPAPAGCSGFTVSEQSTLSGGNQLAAVAANSAEECCAACSGYGGGNVCTAWSYGDNGWETSGPAAYRRYPCVLVARWPRADPDVVPDSSHTCGVKTHDTPVDVCSGFAISRERNYWGGDLAGVWAGSPAECCEQCRGYSASGQQCTAWSYGEGWTHPATGGPAPCWLKGAGYADPPLDLGDHAISGKRV